MWKLVIFFHINESFFFVSVNGGTNIIQLGDNNTAGTSNPGPSTSADPSAPGGSGDLDPAAQPPPAGQPPSPPAADDEEPRMGK